jgi:membrane protease YdiL (CAAX protease family)
VKELVARYPVGVYFGLAYLVTWLIWTPLVLDALGLASLRLPDWWHYAGAVGPISAAVAVTLIAWGRRGVWSLFAQLRPSRLSRRWTLFALGSPVALFALAAAAVGAITGEWPTYEGIAKTQNLPALGLALTWLVHLVTFGIGEEAGWRGFALPRLQARHGAVGATLLLALGWGLWHLPTFIYSPGMRELGLGGTVGWAIGLVAGAFFLTWLYNSSRAALLGVVLWHTTFNVLVASEAAAGSIAAVMTMVILGAGILLFMVRPQAGFPTADRMAPHRHQVAGVG